MAVGQDVPLWSHFLNSSQIGLQIKSFSPYCTASAGQTATRTKILKSIWSDEQLEGHLPVEDLNTEFLYFASQLLIMHVLKVNMELLDIAVFDFFWGVGKRHLYA